MLPPSSEREPRRKRIDFGMVILIFIAVAGGLGVWLLRGPERFFAILGEDALLILKIGPKILAAMLLAAWMRLLMSEQAVARWFGRGAGWAGFARAYAGGAILPGGPMTAYPIAAAFGRAGADIGATAVFLASWMLLSLNRTIVWEMAFIDYDTVLQRLLITLPVPILIGLVAQATGRPSFADMAEGERR
ncbi:MAG: hypothetical protein MRY74_11605 [Neomegalonema sp.]|nr:hypothetical protein [Neomegalonema sp.]